MFVCSRSLAPVAFGKNSLTGSWLSVQVVSGSHSLAVMGEVWGELGVASLHTDYFGGIFEDIFAELGSSSCHTDYFWGHF